MQLYLVNESDRMGHKRVTEKEFQSYYLQPCSGYNILLICSCRTICFGLRAYQYFLVPVFFLLYVVVYCFLWCFSNLFDVAFVVCSWLMKLLLSH